MGVWIIPNAQASQERNVALHALVLARQCKRESSLVILQIQAQRHSPFSEMRTADYGSGAFPGHAERGHQDCHQQGNNADHHEQLDEGETIAIDDGQWMMGNWRGTPPWRMPICPPNPSLPLVAAHRIRSFLPKEHYLAVADVPLFAALRLGSAQFIKGGIIKSFKPRLPLWIPPRICQQDSRDTITFFFWDVGTGVIRGRERPAEQRSDKSEARNWRQMQSTRLKWRER